MELKISALHWLVAGAQSKSGYMTHDTPRDPRDRGMATVAFIGIVVGGLLIVGAAYLGANPNNKSAQPISSSAHTGAGAETNGSGNSSR